MVDRRGFLQLGGLVIGFALAPRVRRFADAAPEPAKPVVDAAAVNAFLHIDENSVVTIYIPHSEMGQGVWTGLAMLVAEELEADWTKIRVEHAPAAPAYYRPGRTAQGTGGSTSTRSEFDRLRQ